MSRPSSWNMAIVSVSLAALLPIAESHAAEPAFVSTEYLAGLRSQIARAHPSVAAAQARAEAAAAAVRSVRLWEDPVAGLAGMIPEDEAMAADEGDLTVSAEAPLPRFKLFEARRAKAEAERRAAQSDIAGARLNVETVAAQTAIELALMDEMIAIEEAELTWMRSMATNALQRLKNPTASASEPLRIQSELAREQQKIVSLRNKRRQIAQQLQLILTGLHDPNRAWPRLKLPAQAPAAPADRGREDWSKRLAVNPEIENLRHLTDAAGHEVAIAKREAGPVVSLGVDSSFYSGSGFRQSTVGLKVSLPWFNDSSYRANIERARHSLEASQRQTDATLRDLEFRALAAQTDADNAFDQARNLQRDVIPRIQEAADSVEVAWISSQASVLEVLDSRRLLQATRVEERRSIAEGMVAIETLRSLLPPAPSTDSSSFSSSKFLGGGEKRETIEDEDEDENERNH